MAAMSAAGKIGEKALEKLTFASKVPMLLKATSDDQEPTAGYLYQEITKMTFESIANCTSLLEFLNFRLKKQSPLVKYKVLKIMTYVSTNGQSEFRSALRHKAEIIRDSTNFNGPLDPLHGDALNKKVQTAASGLIELLFNVENPESTEQSFAMAGPTGKKMEGFGNTPIQPSKSDSFMDSVRGLTKHLPAFGGPSDKGEGLIGYGKSSSQFDGRPKGGTLPRPKGGTLPPAVPSSIQFVNYGDLSSTESGSNGVWSDQGFRSPGDDDDDSDADDAIPSFDDSADLSPESRLVNDITAEGGVRSLPSRDALQTCAKRCESLDTNTILTLLNDKLGELTTEVQMKALHVLEHLLKSGLPDIASRMLQCCDALTTLVTTETGSLQAKANKVLLLAKARENKQKQLVTEHRNTDLLVADNNEYTTQSTASMESKPSLDLLLLSGGHEQSIPGLDHVTSSCDAHLQPSCSARDMQTSRGTSPVATRNVTDMFQGLQLTSTSHPLQTPNSLSQTPSYTPQTPSNTPRTPSNPAPQTPCMNSLSGLDFTATTTSTLNHQKIARAENPMDMFDPLHGFDSSCSEPSSNSPDLLGLSPCDSTHAARLLMPSNSSASFPDSSVAMQPALLTSSKSGISIQSQNTQNPSLLSYHGSTLQTSQTGFTSSPGILLQTSAGQTTTGSMLSKNQSKLENQTGLTGLTQTGFTSVPGFRQAGSPQLRMPMAHAQSLAGTSSIPVRLPKPAAQHKTEFDFISKPKREEAFSFVQDEIRARKK